LPVVADARVRVTVPEPVIVDEPSEAVRPGDVIAERFTVPLKPLSPARVTVVVPELPTLKARLFGEAEIAKSTTLTDSTTE